MFDADLAAPLRDALTAARFTPESVHAALGEAAHEALMRNETTPARRATADGSPLSALVRLFSLQLPVPLEQVERALPGLTDRLCLAGVLERSVAEVRARVDVRPYGDETHDRWIVCDLTPGLDGGDRTVHPDHVLGISEASMSLAQLTVRRAAGRALDLGTGCGVQALHLTDHVADVVATDVNRRALAMARATAALNDVRVDVREGSLLEPVRGERFDLVVTNPPFVISPATGERLVYRDSGLPGDEVVRRLVSQAPDHLEPGGTLQVLANWVHREGEPWQERVGGWIEGTGCDAWVLQREVADPPAYVEMWLADAGLHGTPTYLERYDSWLAWFDEQGIEGVGFGWLCLRRTDAADPVVRAEHWASEVERPLGPTIAAWGDALERVRLDDATLLATHLLRPDDVVQEAVSVPGAAEPDHLVLRQGSGVRRARRVDTVEAALVGVCDGDLAVGAALEAIATLLEADPDAVRDAYLPSVRELVAEGFLT